MDETRKKTEHVYSKETRRRNPFLGFLTIAITLCLASTLISPGSGVEAAAGSIETRPVVTSIWQPTPPPWGPPTIVLPTPRPRVAPIQPINPEPRQCDASELVIESTEPANIKVIGADKLSQFLATQNSRLFIVNTEVTPDMQLFLTVKRDPGLVMAIHTEQGDLPIAKATQNEECKAGERTHVRINSETRRLDILSGSGVSIDSIDESN